MLKVSLNGRLTHEPKAVSPKLTSLSLAVDCGAVSADKPDQRLTMWVDLRVVGPCAASALKLRTGDLVVAIGDGQPYEYQPLGAERTVQKLQILTSSVGLVSRPTRDQGE